MTTPRPRPLVALHDCIGALPIDLAWTGDERERWIAMVTATADALIAVRPGVSDMDTGTGDTPADDAGAGDAS